MVANRGELHFAIGQETRESLDVLPPGMSYNKVVITGAPRTGTTLLQYMMRCFQYAHVLPGETPGLFALPHALFAPVVTVSKAPGDVLQLENLLHIWPHTFCLFTTRHPLDTLCSARPGHTLDWRQRLDFMEQSLANRNRFGQEHRGHSLSIRYEELVQWTDQVQWSISMATGLQPTVPFSRYSSIPNHPEMNDEQPLVPLYHTSIGRWRDPEKNEWIEEIMRDAGDRVTKLLREESYLP